MSEIELDAPKFREWLVTAISRLGETTITELALENITRPAAGQSNETLLFDAVWHNGRTRRRAKLVARLQPSGQQIFLGADVVREGRVIGGQEKPAVRNVSRLETLFDPGQAVLAGGPHIGGVGIETQYPRSGRECKSRQLVAIRSDDDENIGDAG